VSETRAPSAPQVQAQTQLPAQDVELTPEQKELLDAMNNLIMSAQELSYVVALLPNELVDRYPELKELVDAARSVVRATWHFYKIIKRRARR